MWLHGVVRRRYVAARVRHEEESGRVALTDGFDFQTEKHLNLFITSK